MRTVTRPRCVPPLRAGTPGDRDPRRWVHRWERTGATVLARAEAAGAHPLIPREVWEAAADPATWDPGTEVGPAGDMARVLGGWDPVDWNRREGSLFLRTLALWRQGPDPEVIRRRWADTDSAWRACVEMAGLPPGHGPVTRDLGVRQMVSTLIEPGPRRSWMQAGAAALEALAAHVADRRTRRRNMVRGTRILFSDGVTGRLDSEGGVTIGTPMLWEPVRLPVGTLATEDPRLARRFLQVFNWTVWLRVAWTVPAVAPTVVSWLAAVAPAERWAARELAGLGTGRLTLLEPVECRQRAVLALRAAGHPGADLPSRGIGTPRVTAAPVLWRRRWIVRMLRHPDPSAVAEAAEADWVRLCTGT